VNFHFIDEEVKMMAMEIKEEYIKFDGNDEKKCRDGQ